MSNLIIINGTKPTEGCANYYVSITNHAPGEGLDLEYIDCWGRPMKNTIQDDGSNQATIDTYLCAKIDTLVTNGVYVQQDTTPCQDAPYAGGSFEYFVTNYQCTKRGDGPTNFDTYWSWDGSFTLQQLTGISYGTFRDEFGKILTPSEYVDVSDSGSAVGNPIDWNSPSSSCPEPYYTLIFQHTLDGQNFGGNIYVTVRH